MQKLRLLWMSDSPILNTGFAKVTRELLWRLAKEPRYEIACFGWFHNPQFCDPQRMPYPIFAADSQTYGQSNFQQAITHFQPDVVVTLGDIWMIDWIADVQCRGDFVWVGYVPIDGKPLPSPWVDILRQMEQVIAMSQFGQDVIHTTSPSLKPKFIPLGVDTSVFQPLANREMLREQEGLADRFVIGCVARNQPRKQLPLLLQAAASFHKDFPESLLYLHTDPHDAAGWDLEELLQRYNLLDSVIISDKASVVQGVDENRLNQIYNLFDVFVLPTMAEGFGLPLLESMAAGVPVVATDCSSCRELVAEHGELIKVKAWLTTAPYGIEYALADVSHLEQLLKLFLTQLPLRAKYCESGRAFAQRFEWNHLLREWRSLLEQWMPRTRKISKATVVDITPVISPLPEERARTPLAYDKATTKTFPLNIEPIIIPQNIHNVLISADIKGLGDVKSRLAAIQSLRKQRPDIEKVGYLGPKGIVDILNNHPDVDYILTPRQEIPSDAFVADLTEATGRWEAARSNPLKESREEIYTRMFGLKWEGEKPRLHLKDLEMRWGRDFVSHSSKNKLGVALRTAETWKDWQYVLDFIFLAKADYDVFLFDQEIKIDGVINVVGYSLREVMAVLCYMDCVVSPDTGIHHLAEALDVPCIALFGSMDTERYLNRGYDCTVDYIQGRCAHGKKPCMYILCSGKGSYQPCMDWFKPEFVLGKVEGKVKYGTIRKTFFTMK